MRSTYTTERIPYELEKDRSRAYFSPAGMRKAMLKPGVHIKVIKGDKETILKAAPKFDGDDLAIYLPAEELVALGVSSGESVGVESAKLDLVVAESVKVRFVAIKKTVEALASVRMVLEDKKAVRTGEVINGGRVDTGVTGGFVQVTEQTRVEIVAENRGVVAAVGLGREIESICRIVRTAHAGKEGAPRGVVVVGGVGMGKKTFCRVVLDRLGRDWVRVRVVGNDARELVEAYAYAKLNEPCTLWIDRADRYFSEEKLGAPVVEIESMLEDIHLHQRRIAVVATAKTVASLPEELLGARVFDTVVHLAAPSLGQRQEQIVQAVAEHQKEHGCVCPEELIVCVAQRTAGFSRGELHQLLRDSLDVPLSSLAGSSEHQVAILGGQLESMHISTASSAVSASVSSNSSSADLGLGCMKHLLSQIVRIVPSASNESSAEVPDVRFSSVFGQTKAKAKLTEAVLWPIQHQALFEEEGVVPPKGVLLYGPPGCGKTLLAQALANESGAVFLSIRGPEIMGKYVGESEERLRRVFARARALTPSIVFIDEIDSIAPHREAEGGQVDKRVVSTLLTEMDGVGSGAGVFVLGATNKPWSIDSALLRPGRFDHHVLVDIPDLSTRTQLLSSKLDKICLGIRKWAKSTEDLAESRKELQEFLLKHTSVFTGAELVGLCNELSMQIIRMRLDSRGYTPNEIIEQLKATASHIHSRITPQEHDLFVHYEQASSRQ
ncbi:hypothetical protein NEHOM01_0416 [Nematocida homosporus]|uniref:uncharacterized protein n=1 Tax=Nematocida homosporus TaxID=1912981 RepID=UPI00221E4E7E|nr:uncharacterized protein NEHOM01_0416 [Nematocida homosporus]KAI5184814.1 hypothetical protein NEHOM01_0416 [Nematocida homosporus]